MANISVTYNFVNGTAADGDAVDTNFQDIINGTSDGTKDLAISALTCGGTATFNGNVLLGNASADDIQFNGSLATSIPIKVTRTYNIGSADLGLAIIYLGMNSTYTIALQGPSSGASADYTLELPATVGVIGQGLVRTSTTAVGWTPMQTDINSVASADYIVLDNDGYSLILVTTGSSDRTVTLPTAADNTDRVLTIKKADSGTGNLIIDPESTEALDGSSTSVTLYAENDAVTIKCDGTGWYRLSRNSPPTSMVRCDTPNGHGSTNTKIRRFTNATTTGSAITYADSATDGGSFTINEDGVYAISFTDFNAASSSDTGISVNSNQLTTSISSITTAHRLVIVNQATNLQSVASATARLAAGDVVRAHTGGSNSSTSAASQFIITQVAKF